MDITSFQDYFTLKQGSRSPFSPMLLFFRHRSVSDPVIGPFEESTLETLRRKFSGNIWVLPHLYDLPDFCEEFREIRDNGEPIVAFSWLPVRAAFARLRQRTGVTKLTCFDLAEIHNSAVSLESLSFPDSNDAEIFVEIRRSEKSLHKRWYPIIDEQVCQNCLECVNFCLFGVYTIQENQTPLVEQPDQCRDGCPACSRVCPAGAILFPEYDDPVISGRQKRTEIVEPATKDELDRLIDQVEGKR